MTKHEILKMFTDLNIAFPANYKGYDSEKMKQAVNLWIEHFKNEDAGTTLRAVSRIIDTRKNSYGPSIGEIKAAAAEISRDSRRRGMLTAEEKKDLVEYPTGSGRMIPRKKANREIALYELVEYPPGSGMYLPPWDAADREKEKGRE